MGASLVFTRSWAPGPPMSIEALASRLDNSVANSLYSEASAVGAAPPFDRLVDEGQAEHAGHLGLGGQLGDALADDGVVA